MDLTLLKYFIAVAQSQHITNTAHQLNITQPALSAAIRRLEGEIGVPLFEKSGRNIQLNDYGKLYLSSATAALDILSNAQIQIDELKKQKAMLIRLACPSALFNASLIDLLIPICGNLKITNIHGIQKSDLLGNHIDLAITNRDFHHPALNEIEVDRSRYIVLVNRSHPLAAMRSVAFDDLRLYSFAAPSSTFSSDGSLYSHFLSSGFFPQVTFTNSSLSVLISAIRGSSHLAGIFVESEVRSRCCDELVMLPISGPDMTAVKRLYYRSSDANNHTLLQVCQIITDFFRNPVPADALSDS